MNLRQKYMLYTNSAGASGGLSPSDALAMYDFELSDFTAIGGGSPSVDDEIATMTDASGNHTSATGTTGNTATYQSDHIRFVDNKLMTFDGSIVVGVPYIVVAVFASVEGSGYDWVVGGTGNTTNNNLHMGWNNSDAAVIDQWNRGLSGTPVPGINTSYRTFLGSNDGTTRTLYVDGNLVNSTTTDVAYLDAWAGSAIAFRQFQDNNNIQFKHLSFWSPNSVTIVDVQSYIDGRYS
jgi:hypothetical protein